MSFTKFLVINHLFLCVIITIDGSHKMKEYHVWAGLGMKARLPCPSSPEFVSEVPILILWFKGSIKEAIYSFDSRHKEFPEGEEWSDDVILGRRAEFLSAADPPSLLIQQVAKQDDDTYVCRVNYFKSQANYIKVNLSVVVPPKPPTILWEDDEVLGEAGPFLEGEGVDLSCQADGGYPRPTVTWWRQGRNIKADEEWKEVDGELVTRAHLSLMASRSLHKTPLICHARANHPDHALSRPLTTAITLSITLPPLSVEIANVEEIITAGTTIKPTCIVIGSHPPADISWWKNGKRLTHVNRSVREGGNVSTATITLHPSHLDHGSNLTCRGSNPSLIGPELSDFVILNIVYPPIVTLSLGQNLNKSTLKEGHDAFFECNVLANPPPHRLEWFFNGKPMQGQRKGVLMSVNSLVLQHLKKEQSGGYSCAAHNLQGRDRSKEIVLDVKYAPVCASDTSQRTQGAAMGRSSSILCHVESNPSQKVIFKWSRLLPSGREKEIDNENITSSEGMTSRLTVTPTHLDDFGQYLCRARNSLGIQELPCRVILVTAGPPEPPGNCSANPQLSKTLFVSCREGFHGGFPQKFRLQAWQKNLLVANITSEIPEWSLENLNTEESLKLKLESLNAKGPSQPVHFHLHSPVAHQQATTESRDTHNDMSVVAGIVMGVLIALLLTLLSILLFVHKKRDSFSKKSASRLAEKRLPTNVASAVKGPEDCDKFSSTTKLQSPILSTDGKKLTKKENEIDNTDDRSSYSSSSDSCCSSQITVLAGSTTQFKPTPSTHTRHGLPSHLSGSVPNSLSSYNKRKEAYYSKNYKYRQKNHLESGNYRDCSMSQEALHSRCSPEVCECHTEGECSPLRDGRLVRKDRLVPGHRQCLPIKTSDAMVSLDDQDTTKRDSFHLLDYPCTPKANRNVSVRPNPISAPMALGESDDSDTALHVHTLPAKFLANKNGDAKRTKFITKPKNSQRESTV